MATERDLFLLFIFLFNNIQHAGTTSNKLFVASPPIGTFKRSNLSFLEIRQAKSEIQCASQCLDAKQCIAITYKNADRECRLYHDAEHLADLPMPLLFRVIDCPDGWISFDKSCYQINEDTTSWYDAMEACKVMDGNLVEIESARENNFLNGLILESTAKETNYYIGGTDEETEGEWIWASSGNRMNYTNWKPGTPNGITGENHLCKVFSRSDGMWNDCDGSKNLPSICEI